MRKAMSLTFAAILVLCIATHFGRSRLEMLVLNALYVSQSSTCEIALQLREMDGLKVSDGAIGRVVNRLQIDGYVRAEGEQRPATSMHRPYSLTAAGRKRVDEMNSLVSAPFPGDFVLDWRAPKCLKALSWRVCNGNDTSREGSE